MEVTKVIKHSHLTVQMVLCVLFVSSSLFIIPEVIAAYPPLANCRVVAEQFLGIF